MATTPMESTRRDDNSGARSLEPAVRDIEKRLADIQERSLEPGLFGPLGEQLQHLHAKLRQHQSSGSFCGVLGKTPRSAPELGQTIKRLEIEASALLGDLDRLIRSVAYIADALPEDREIFTRVKEFFATLRRHRAEEDRLCFHAVWRDTGGES